MTEIELFDKLNPKRDLPQATCDVISQVYKVMQKENRELQEKLEKEAYEESEKLKEYQTNSSNEYEKGFNNGEVRGYKDGYRDGAEPREKRIEELEKENAELKKEVEKHKWNNIFLEDCADYDKKIAEEYTTLQERISELEKENAELKAELTKKADTNHSLVEQMADLEAKNAELKEWKEQTIKARGRDYMDWSKMYDQLTKAKDLLKRFLGLGNLWDLDCKDYFPLRKEAEQFLSEVEK